eukprot:613907-Rhodomonas_salina.1
MLDHRVSKSHTHRPRLVGFVDPDIEFGDDKEADHQDFDERSSQVHARQRNSGERVWEKGHRQATKTED